MVREMYSTTGNVATDVIDAGSDALNKTLDTSTDLLKSAGSGATNLISDTLGLAASGVSDAAGMARDTLNISVTDFNGLVICQLDEKEMAVFEMLVFQMYLQSMDIDTDLAKTLSRLAAIRKVFNEESESRLYEHSK